MILLQIPRVGRFRLSLHLRQLILPIAVSLLSHGLLVWSVTGLAPNQEVQAGNNPSVRIRLQQAPLNPRQPEAQLAATDDTTAARLPEERSYPQSAPNELLAETPSRGDAPTESEQNGDGSPAPFRPSINLAGLRQYHQALSQASRQFKNYPQAALEAGLRGRVAIRLTVAENGVALGLTLIGSSGNPMLDRAALEVMRLAASHTEVPESLRDRNFTIDLAMDFNPEDAP